MRGECGKFSWVDGYGRETSGDSCDAGAGSRENFGVVPECEDWREDSVATSLQIAQLALKHRLNKNQKQRIVVFIASPVAESEDVLVKLGQKLRKNAISLDLINLENSNPEQNQKLQKLVDATKDASDNSHYVQVQPGIQLLSNVLLNTPVLMTGEAGAGGMNEFGMGAGMDPELEMALRISLEEEKARNEKKDDNIKEGDNKGGDNKMKIEEQSKPAENVDEMDEEELLRRAQELSLQDVPPSGTHNKDKGKEEKVKEEIFQDPDFVNELLSEIPGLDKENPEIKKTLEKIQKKDESEGDKDKK